MGLAVLVLLLAIAIAGVICGFRKLNHLVKTEAIGNVAEKAINLYGGGLTARRSIIEASAKPGHPMAQRKLQHLVQSETEFETASLRAALLLALPLFVPQQ